MSVYVDNQKNPYRGMLMCHMLADTLPELHDMAAKLGLKPEWFQNERTPHYDICQTKRKLALELGAVEADRNKVVELIRKYRKEART
jgi:uncharacterized protein DUF4031